MRLAKGCRLEIMASQGLVQAIQRNLEGALA